MVFWLLRGLLPGAQPTPLAVDGVVIVPFSQIDGVIRKLEALKDAEAKFEEKIKSGLVEPDYIEELMSSIKTQYIK